MNRTLPSAAPLQAALLILCLSAGLSSTAWAQAGSILADNPANKLTNGGFEVEKPAYWAAEGEGATWSTEQARTPNFSLKLSGAGQASWTMDELVRNWEAGVAANTDLEVGAWVWTDGVNTDPASDEEKFQLVFTFLDADGNDLLGESVILDLPQSQASTGGWVEISSAALGALSLPGQATSASIVFRKGASATGTAYLDDAFMRGAGTIFNANVDAGDTWYYWWGGGFSSGDPDWPDSLSFTHTITDEVAHSGSYSLKIEQQDPEASETVAISDRVPVTVGEPVLVSFWVQTEGVAHPDSIGKADYNIGLTALWYDNLEGGAAGWGEIGGADIRLNGDYNDQVIPLLPRQEATGWTQYAFVVYPREGAVGMELRLRYWHHFEGTTYWDDVSIINIGGGSLTTVAIEDEPGERLPDEARLGPNFPNPFRTVTTIAFELDQAEHVSLEVFNLLGQRVATLVDDELLGAGPQRVLFNGGSLPSGLYVYRLRTGDRTEARTMVLVR